MQSLESQFFSFAVTVLMGLTVGVLFDFYNITKGIIRPRKLGTYLGDFLFWVITTIVIFFMLLIGNWGELRFYVVIGVLTGVVVYIKLFSRTFIRVLLSIIKFSGKVITKVVRTIKYAWFIITYPVILIKNTIIIPIGFVGRTYQSLCKFLGFQGKRLVINPVKIKSASIKNKVKQKLMSCFKKKS